MYPHRFMNIHAFVQRVALDIVQHGYWFYVTGVIPEGRDPSSVDAKLLAKYDMAVSKWTRSRRKKKGQANVHYVRHQDFFVMLASKGQHRWFQEEEWGGAEKQRLQGSRILDIRHTPLVRGGYSISYKQCSGTGRGHVTVRIHPGEYRALKDYLVGRAMHGSLASMSEEFRLFPFEPYAGVRQQRWNILRAVNGTRRRAGFEQLDAAGVLRKKRRIFKLLEPVRCGLSVPNLEEAA